MKNDKLRKNLEEIRDGMVEEDLDRENRAEKLSDIQERSLYSRVEKKTGFLLRFFNRKNLSVAAALLIILISIPLIKNTFMAGSPNKSQEKTAESGAPKMEESPLESDAKADSKSGNIGISDLNIGSLPQGQKIIYKYFYVLETTDFKAAEEALNDLIKRTQSYVESAELFKSKNSNMSNGSFVVRVHKDQAASFKDSLKNIATIVSQSVTSENKTKYYRDLEKEKEFINIKLDRYKELLKNAKTIEDALKIENLIARAQADLANINKNISNVDEDVTYQTFSLEIRGVGRVLETDKDSNSLTAKIRDAFADSISHISYFFESVLLFVIRNWLLIIVIICFAFIILRKIIKHR